jgi:hypothetical protein
MNSKLKSGGRSSAKTKRANTEFKKQQLNKKAKVKKKTLVAGEAAAGAAANPLGVCENSNTNGHQAGSNSNENSKDSESESTSFNAYTNNTNNDAQSTNDSDEIIDLSAASASGISANHLQHQHNHHAAMHEEVMLSKLANSHQTPAFFTGPSEFNYRNFIIDSFYQKNLYNGGANSNQSATNNFVPPMNTTTTSRRANSNNPANNYTANNTSGGNESLLIVLNKINTQLISEKQNGEKMRDALKECLYEKNQVFALLKKCQTERDQLSVELANYHQLRDRELRKCKAQLEHVSKEYQQVMSERDTVHKEIEALQEKLTKTEGQLKQLSSSSNTSRLANSASLAAVVPHSIYNTSNVVEHHNLTNTNRFSILTQNSMFTDNFISNNDRLNETLEELEIDCLKNQLRQVAKQRDDALIKV